MGNDHFSGSVEMDERDGRFDESDREGNQWENGHEVEGREEQGTSPEGTNIEKNVECLISSTHESKEHSISVIQIEEPIR